MKVGTETNHFTFPEITAELSDELIDEVGLREPLRKAGELLIAQMSERGCVGLKINGLTFTMMLGDLQ